MSSSKSRILRIYAVFLLLFVVSLSFDIGECMLKKKSYNVRKKSSSSSTDGSGSSGGWFKLRGRLGSKKRSKETTDSAATADSLPFSVEDDYITASQLSLDKSPASHSSRGSPSVSSLGSFKSSSSEVFAEPSSSALVSPLAPDVPERRAAQLSFDTPAASYGGSFSSGFSQGRYRSGDESTRPSNTAAAAGVGHSGLPSAFRVNKRGSSKPVPPPRLGSKLTHQSSSSGVLGGSHHSSAESSGGESKQMDEPRSIPPSADLSRNLSQGVQQINSADAAGKRLRDASTRAEMKSNLATSGAFGHELVANENTNRDVLSKRLSRESSTSVVESASAASASGEWPPIHPPRSHDRRSSQSPNALNSVSIASSSPIVLEGSDKKISESGIPVPPPPPPPPAHISSYRQNLPKSTKPRDGAQSNSVDKPSKPDFQTELFRRLQKVNRNDFASRASTYGQAAAEPGSAGSSGSAGPLVLGNGDASHSRPSALRSRHRVVTQFPSSPSDEPLSDSGRIDQSSDLNADLSESTTDVAEKSVFGDTVNTSGIPPPPPLPPPPTHVSAYRLIVPKTTERRIPQEPSGPSASDALIEQLKNDPISKLRKVERSSDEKARPKPAEDFRSNLLSSPALKNRDLSVVRAVNPAEDFRSNLLSSPALRKRDPSVVRAVKPAEDDGMSDELARKLSRFKQSSSGSPSGSPRLPNKPKPSPRLPRHAAVTDDKS